jgi:hypothetical protein
MYILIWCIAAALAFVALIFWLCKSTEPKTIETYKIKIDNRLASAECLICGQKFEPCYSLEVLEFNVWNHLQKHEEIVS